MATRNSTDVGYLLVGGRSLLSSVGTLADKVSAETAETTPLGASSPTHVASGLKRATLTQDGWFDDASGGANESALAGTTSQVVAYAPAGNVIGRNFRGFAGSFSGDYERIVKVGDIHRAKVSYTISGAHEEGLIVADLAERTTGANTDATGADNLTTAASGGAGYLQVSSLALGGYTNLIVKVRHSSDNITFSDLLTFTAVTSGPSAERKTTASSTNRYLSISWSWTGSGTGQTATFTVGFARTV